MPNIDGLSVGQVIIVFICGMWCLHVCKYEVKIMVK